MEFSLIKFSPLESLICKSHKDQGQYQKTEKTKRSGGDNQCIIFDRIAEQVSQKVTETFNRVQDLLKQGEIFQISEVIKDLERQILDLIWETVLKFILSDKYFLKRLRALGAKKALKFISYQQITIILPTGTRIRVRGPFFVKAKPKRGRKKPGPQNRGAHLALELLGFVGKVAPELAFHAIQLAVLAPSFEIASEMLKQESIELSANKIRQLCRKLGNLSLPERIELILDGEESFEGKRVLIGIDGGRLRSRKTKRGPIPKGKKYHGFHPDWIEPKLFTIYLLDDNGNIIKELNPFVDGTTGKLPQLIKLFSQYLTILHIEQASEVTIVGDGAPWIWERIPTLLEKLGVAKEKISQLIDWTHAKQNLLKAFTTLPHKILKNTRFKIKTFKDLLFEGKIDKIASKIKDLFKISEKSKIMKKLKSYFFPNQERMQYKEFVQRKLPIGSGVIESAIRRVVNLRLKSPGSFWKLDCAEIMIFLRAQLLYGRWQIFKKNWMKKLYHEFQTILSHAVCQHV